MKSLHAMKNIHAISLPLGLSLGLSLGLLSVNLAQAAPPAAPGDLDVSFGGTGIVATLPLKTGTGFNGTDVIQQKDGKLVVVGNSYDKKGTKNFAVLRYNINGTPDTDFNGTGQVVTVVSVLPKPFKSVDEAKSVIQQDDGKILVAGTTLNGTDTDFALVRYNKDGSLDESFNETGILTTEVGVGNDVCNSVIQQTDGKLVAAGYSVGANKDFALVRYERDGSLDYSFGVNGIVTTAVGSGDDYGQSVIQLADGKLLVAGYSEYNFALVRYNSDGSLDTTFDGDGKLFGGVMPYPAASYGLSVIQQADNKIVVAGYTNTKTSSQEDMSIARYNLDGSFDTSFSGDGQLILPIGASSDYGSSVIQQADGKLVLGGYSYVGSNIHFALVRLNTDGTLDTSFSSDGMLTTAVGSVGDQAYSVIQQSDGKLVLAGYGNSGKFNYIALARYHSENDTDGDGVPDSLDALPNDPTESVDTDGDLIGNNADPDDDGDGVADTSDNCPLDANPAQTDTDSDGYGDVCDSAAPLLDEVKGTAVKDRAGYAVAYAGDVDKDGVGDYIIGTPGFDAPGKIDAGSAVVISGKTGGPLMSIFGAAPKDAMGSAVAGNADIDGDGYLDVVVGAPKADSGALVDAGSVTVMFGPDDSKPRQTFYGATAKALFGSALALGNVNGDAYADILIGAPKDDDTTHPFTKIMDAGSVTVRSGDPATYSAAPLKVFYGAMAKAYAGTSVAAGDFNGDGNADVIIGAPGEDDNFTDPSKVYADAGTVTVYDIGGAILMYEYGAGAKANLGKSVASADVDNDGIDEILAGAPGDDLLDINGKPKRKDAGSITLYSYTGVSTPVGQLLQYYGRTAKAGLGNSVAFGDVNGDGLPDIIAGASKDDKPAKKPLKDVGSVSVWNAADFSLITTLYGKVSKDYFGSAVGAGDANNDGKDDLFVGVVGADRTAVAPAKPVKDTGSMVVVSGANL